ncbi:MAG: hypothetical protein K2H87_01440, partial [Duncaniella sp.]|nr:hypothetical protein [Duncaniella sp.]
TSTTRPITNLRLSPDARKLRGVRPTGFVTVYGLVDHFLDPVTSRAGDGSEWLFYVERNGSLCCFGFPYDGGVELDPVAGDITSVVLADGILYVFASDRPVRCYEHVPGRIKWVEREFSCHGLCSIVRRDLAVESAPVPPITLKGSYDSRTHTVADADAVAIGSALRTAYRRIADASAANHRYVQPVMARYKLVGRDGTVLYTSAPVLVAPAEGLQMTSAQMHVDAPGYAQTSQMTLSASAFGLEVVKANPDSEIWTNLVDHVEIEVAPQLHPLDTASGGASICRYLGVEGQNLRYRCLVPGWGDGVQPGAPGGCGAGYVDAVLAFGAELFRPYALPLGTMDDDIETMRRMAARLVGLRPA